MDDIMKNAQIPHGRRKEECALLFKHVFDMFGESIDGDVILAVLESKNWDVNQAADDLIQLQSTVNKKCSQKTFAADSSSLKTDRQDNHSGNERASYTFTRSWTQDSNSSENVARDKSEVNNNKESYDEVVNDDSDADVIIEEEKEVLLKDDCTNFSFDYDLLFRSLHNGSLTVIDNKTSFPFLQQTSSKDNSPDWTELVGRKQSNSKQKQLLTPKPEQRLITADLFFSNYIKSKMIKDDLQRIYTLAVNNVKIVVLLRGAPGSGKSFTANLLLKKLSKSGKVNQSHYNRHIYSTDDYFISKNGYDFNSSKLSEAHTWNQKRFQKAVEKEISPLIVDNTNTQLWEMQPYVSVAVLRGYHIEVLEPISKWKKNEKELFKHNIHNVPKQQIRRMLERFELRNITPDALLHLLGIKYSRRCKPPQPVPNSGVKVVPMAKHAEPVEKKKKVRTRNKKADYLKHTVTDSSFSRNNEDTSLKSSENNDVEDSDTNEAQSSGVGDDDDDDYLYNESLSTSSGLDSLINELRSIYDGDTELQDDDRNRAQDLQSDIVNLTGLSSDSTMMVSKEQIPQEVFLKTFETAKNIKNDFDRIVMLVMNNVRVLVLLRGCSGSGKTFTARRLIDEVSKSPQFAHRLKYADCVFSADDFFTSTDSCYIFDRHRLSEAHLNNQTRVDAAMKSGISPVVVDNCNVEMLEMKPYVEMAVKYGFYIELLEPDTDWKLNEHELTVRNVHSVSRIKIKYMLDRFERDVTRDKLLKKFDLSYPSDKIPPVKVTDASLSGNARDYFMPDDKIDNVHDDIKSLSKGFVRSTEETEACEARGLLSYADATESVEKALPICDIKHDKKFIPILNTIMHEIKDDLDRILTLVLCNVKVLVLMRGCYGSGKSYAAKQLIDRLNELNSFNYPLEYSEHIFCDNVCKTYYLENNMFFGQLYKNFNAVKESMQKKKTPIIIDNCNIAIEEMSEYARLAYENGYVIDIFEPDTAWKYDADELAKNASHPISKPEIRLILSMFDKTIDRWRLIDVLQLRYDTGLLPKIEDTELYLHALRTLYPLSTISNNFTTVNSAEWSALTQDGTTTSKVGDEKNDSLTDTEIDLDVVDQGYEASVSRLITEENDTSTVSTNDVCESNSDLENHESDNESITSSHEHEDQSQSISDSDSQSSDLETLKEFTFDVGTKQYNASDVNDSSHLKTKCEYSKDSASNELSNLFMKSLLKKSCSDITGASNFEADVIGSKQSLQEVNVINFLIDNEVSKDCEVDIKNENCEDVRKSWEPPSVTPKKQNDDSPKPPRSGVQRSKQRQSSNNIFTSTDNMKQYKTNKQLLDWSTVPEPNSDWFAQVRDTISGTRKDGSTPKPKRETGVEKSHVNSDVANDVLLEDSSASDNCQERKDSSVESLDTDDSSIDARCIRLLRDNYSRDSVESSSNSVSSNVEEESNTAPDAHELSNLFPDIKLVYLKDLLEKCHGDVNWVAEILFEESLRERNEFLSTTADQTAVKSQVCETCDEALSASHAAGSVVNDLPVDSEPNTKKIKKGLLSKSKTQIYENAAQVKAMIEKSIVLNPSNYSETILKVINKKKRSEGASSRFDSPDAPVAQESTAAPCIQMLPPFPPSKIYPDISEITFEDECAIDYALEDIKPSDCEPEHEIQHDDIDDEDCDDDDNDMLEYIINKDFIVMLYENFGSPALPRPAINSEHVVKLPKSLARQVYSYVTDSIQGPLEQEENMLKRMMIEDQEFARRLQEEEHEMSNSNRTPNLQEIIDMETALALYQAEKDNMQKDSSATFAARLSRKILEEKFPNVDKHAIFDLFKLNNCSLHDTLATLMVNQYSESDLSDWELQLLKKAKEERDKISSLRTITVEQSPQSNYTPQMRLEALNDFECYREEASRHQLDRNTCFEKAKEAYSLGNKNVASYYSQLANIHTQHVELANSKAAATLLTIHQMNSEVTLDLHFYQVKEAIPVLDVFLDSAIRKLRDKHKNKAVLYVITGRGVHSYNGKSKLRPVVMKRLQSRQVQFSSVNPGMLKVIVKKNTLFSNGS